MPPDQPTQASGGGHADEQWLERWLARATLWWRVELGLFVCAAAVGLALAWPPAGVLGLIVLAAATARRFRQHHIVTRIETQVPDLRNALLAWTETRDHVAPAIRQRMASHARRILTRTASVRAVQPRMWLCVALLVVAAIGARALWPHTRMANLGASSQAADPPTSPAVAGVLDWRVRVIEPSYTGLPARTLERPSRVDAVEGARLDITFEEWPTGATAALGRDAVALAETGQRRVASVIARTSDVLVVRDGSERVLATIAVVVKPDAAPQVRITAPGADLRRASAVGTVPIRVVAEDDFGVRALRLRFTKVSGSGESFTFEDGEWPLVITKDPKGTWTGEYTVDLAQLSLAPGDSVAYHAVAYDARPGVDGLSESERYLIEIAREGETAGGDFSIPEPEDKFALSQRMVILLTERLLEKRPRMPREEYVREAQALAVAQRRVRAEFVFMLGGEVQDEIEEAEHSHEVESGRLDNRGQSDLTRAVREMNGAETHLTDAALEEALPYEYRALAALQAAFGRARYFMRTLPVQIRIDPDRRLQGDRSEAGSSRWARAPVAEAKRAAALDVLQRLEDSRSASDEARAAVLPDLIAIDRDDPEWIALCQQLMTQTGAQAVTRALRERLVAGSAEWLPMPLARGEAEASVERTQAASAGGRR